MAFENVLYIGIAQYLRITWQRCAGICIGIGRERRARKPAILPVENDKKMAAPDGNNGQPAAPDGNNRKPAAPDGNDEKLAAPRMSIMTQLSNKFVRKMKRKGEHHSAVGQIKKKEIEGAENLRRKQEQVLVQKEQQHLKLEKRLSKRRKSMKGKDIDDDGKQK